MSNAEPDHPLQWVFDVWPCLPILTELDIAFEAEAVESREKRGYPCGRCGRPGVKALPMTIEVFGEEARWLDVCEQHWIEIVDEVDEVEP